LDQKGLISPQGFSVSGETGRKKRCNINMLQRFILLQGHYCPMTRASVPEPSM
jgi:hypothetical protein